MEETAKEREALEKAARAETEQRRRAGNLCCFLAISTFVKPNRRRRESPKNEQAGLLMK
jgi:hypothetical protein